jgi:hypothetical protein
MTPNCKPQSRPREVVQGAVIVVFLLITLGLLGLAVFSMSGIVGGWEFGGEADRQFEVRFCLAVMELRCERPFRGLTEYALS